MGDKTAIRWTDATYNPIRGVAGNWHCIKISPGCQNCYAARLNMRWGGPDYRVGADTLRLDERALDKPLHWRAPRVVFVCSMTDLFEDRVPDAWIARVFQVMFQARQHTFQVLTKRPERFLALCQGGRVLAGFGLEQFPHVWVGTSIENDDYTKRADVLRQIPAAVRFISAEPLLGPLPSLSLDGIQWLIVGGESGGPEERRLTSRYCSVSETKRGWVRDLRDACVRRGVPFFFKQWGGVTPESGGRLLDGRTWDELPAGAVIAPKGATV